MTCSDDDEAVLIRRLPDEECPQSIPAFRLREIRINCPDATGLGVDIMRVLLDFGLHIIDADMSTDGTWCFLVLKVAVGFGVSPRWSLLGHRLEEICPRSIEALRSLLHQPSDGNYGQQNAFSIQVFSSDRPGMLHSLAHALWDADTTVFRAHVVTTPDGEVKDEFFVYDNRDELPADHRVLEIMDRINGVLGGDSNCQISMLTQEQVDGWSPFNEISPRDILNNGKTQRRGRRLCRQSTSFANLHSVVSQKNRLSGSDSIGSFESSKSFASVGHVQDVTEKQYHNDHDNSSEFQIGTSDPKSEDHFNLENKSLSSQILYHATSFHDMEHLVPDNLSSSSEDGQQTSNISSEDFHLSTVAVDWDNIISPSYTLFTMKCPDRKGLVYDIFLTLKDLDLRVGSARVQIDEETGIASLNLLTQNANGEQIEEYSELMELTDQLRQAALLPVRIDVVRQNDSTDIAEVRVAANIDSGGRGRPRVTYDVTAGLSSSNFIIDNADVFVDKTLNQELISTFSPKKSQEIHRFVVRNSDGSPFQSQNDLDVIQLVVRNCLLGRF